MSGLSEVAAFGIGILIVIALSHFVTRIEMAKLENKIDDVYLLLRFMRREQRDNGL